MAVNLTLKTVFRGDDSNVRAVARDVDKLIDQVIAKARGSVVIPVQIGGMGGSGGGGGGFGGDPSKIIAATLAKIEQAEKLSASRQAQIAGEGEAKRAAIEAQGAQRRINAQAMAQARLESQEAAHLQKLIQQKERAEQKLAMKPRMTAERLQNLGGSLNQAGNSLTMGVTAPVVATAGLALREGIKFESSFADVKKTVAGTAVELDRIKASLREMSAGKNPIPIDINELNKIAASAGELGIRTPEVAQFTKTMAMLGTTTNLTSDQAATSLARIDNILATGQQSFDRYGAALVALGADGASTESEITEMSQRLAGTGKQIGLSAPQVLAFGAAMASVGIESEAGGTSMSKNWKQIDAAVREGGKSLESVAKVAGMTAAEFKRAWQDDAAGATVAFVSGLGKIGAAGGSVAGTLDALGMTESRQQDALTRLAGASGLLASSLKTGETAWRDNSALAAEAGKRYETTASQLQILQNRLREVAIKASEAVLPGVNKELKGFSDGIPEAAQKAASAYEALGPAGQKAALGVLAVAAGAGPTAKMIGTVTTLVGTYQKLAGAAKAATAATAIAGAASGAGALGAGAAGAGAGAAALASNPVGWIILAAAIVAAIALAVKFKGDYDEILSRTKQLAQDAKTLDGAFKRALDGAPNGKIKNQLEELQTEAQGAKGDVEKLETALKSARDTDVKIHKLGLAPSAELPLRQELKGIIASLESQLSIHLKVSAENGTGKPQGKAPRDPVNVQADREADLQKRAAKVGLAWPKNDAPRQRNRDDLMGMMDDVHSVGNYQQKVAALEKQIVAKEKVAHDSRFDARANDALTTYSNNLAKLVNVQKQFDEAVKRGYKPDAAENRSMGNLGTRVNELKEKVQSDRKTRVDKDRQDRANAAKEAATEAADKAKDLKVRRQAEAEARSDQARADMGRSLQEQLSDWKTFEGVVDSVRSGLAQTAEAGSVVSEKTARAKMEASLARREFDGIPQPLKDSAIALAGIQVQLQKIVGTRDALRETFNGIFSGLGAADQEKFAAFTRKLQNGLKLDPQYKALTDRAGAHSDTLSAGTAARTDLLKDRIQANELAGRKPFDDPKNPLDGNLGTVAGRGNAPGWLQAMEADTGKDFGRNCAEEIKARLKGAGFGIGSMSGASQKAEMRVGFDQNGRLPSGAIVRYPPGNGGYSRGHYMAVGSDQSTWTESNFAKKGTAGENDITSGRRAIKWEQLRRDVEAGRAFAFAPRGAVGSSAPVAAQSAPTPQVAAPEVAAPVASGAKVSKSAARKSAPPAPFDGKILNAKTLPKAFGPNMADYQARDGESTQFREAMQATVLRLLNDGMKLSNAEVKDFGKEGLRLDLSKTRRDATREAYREMAGLNRDIRLIGRENSPYAALVDGFEEGKGDAVSGAVKGQLAGTVLRRQKDGLEQSAKQSEYQSERAQKRAGENRSMLGAGYNSESYARAESLTNARFDFWDSDQAKGARQSIEQLRAEGKEKQALEMQTKLNTAAQANLNAAARDYDAPKLKSALEGHAEQMKALKEEAEALERAAKARAVPGRSREMAEDYAEADEAERKARKDFAPSVESGEMTQQDADELSRDKGEATFANAQGKRVPGRQTSLEDYNAAIRDNVALLADQTRAHESMAVDSPELQTQIGLLEERARLLSNEFQGRVDRDATGGLVIPADVQAELDARLAGKRVELDGEHAKSRVIKERQNLLAIQNGILDQQQARELAGVETAQKRLEIELKYEAKKREIATEAETASEAAARAEEDNQRRIGAAEEARRAKNSADREQIKSGFRALLDGNLSGTKGRGLEQGKDWLAQRAADYLKPGKKRDKETGKETSGAVEFTPGIAGKVERFIPRAQRLPGIPSKSSSGDMAGAIKTALSGGIRTARVDVHATVSQVNAGTVNVAGEGGLGAIAKRSGQAGSKPSTEQILSTIFDGF